MSQYILLFSAEGERWFQASKKLAPIAPPERPVLYRLVVDLAEESVQTVTLPRMFGADYTAFLGRRLAEIYPDTRLRAARAFDRNPFASRRHVFLAIGAEDRIQTRWQALERQGATLIGLWPLVAGLAALGQRLPASPLAILAVRFGGAFRLVFFSHRAPLLVRRIRNERSILPEEITRTQRYLISQRMIPPDAGRGIIYPVALSADDLTSLAAAGLNLAPSPVPAAHDDDGVLASVISAGLWHMPQLAPDDWRSRELARQGRIGALIFSVTALAVAGMLAAPAAWRWLNAHKEIAHTLDGMTAAQADIESLRSRIAASGIDLDLLKALDSLETSYLRKAPSPGWLLAEVSRRLASVAPSHPAAWVRWLSTPMPCTNTETRTAAKEASAAATSRAESARFVAELQLKFPLPEGATPRQIRQIVEATEKALSQAEGVRLLEAPDKKLLQRRLSGRAGPAEAGSSSSDKAELYFCLGVES